MPRSNRPRGQRGGVPDEDDPNLVRALNGGLRIESRRGRSWNVQPLSAASAAKTYSCPGCSLPIDPGVPHIVAWRADALFGDADAVSARRHWHTHCWRISG